ncbi:MAG: hypothetical protein HKN39_03015 [Flavobacteriales bacterium]|nr:hypothetical protein [Flavobacteriales bacterium]
MEFFTYVFDAIYSALGNQVFLVLIVVLFIGIVSQWRLYEKAGLKGISSIVPVWNFISFLKIVGRPAWQSLLIMVPLLGILGAFMVDFKDLFAFMGNGFQGFGSVAISFSVLAASTIVLSVFLIKVYIELCDSFGKSTVFDYVLVVLLNFIYILNLSLSYDTVYQGPVYGKKSNNEVSSGARQFA